MMFKFSSFFGNPVNRSGYGSLGSEDDSHKQTDRNDRSPSALRSNSQALGRNRESNPLSENFFKDRKHLKNSSVHAKALTAWKLENESVFEGQDSAAKKTALESLMQEFCRPLKPEENPTDAQGTIAYKGLCSAQKETLSIMAHQFSSLEPKHQTELLNTFIDKYLSFLGASATPEHDPQLRGIETLRNLLEELGNRHEERAQVLSHLLLKVNENDLSKQVHSSMRKVVCGYVLASIGTGLVATTPITFGLLLPFGAILINDGVKFIRSQDKAVNLGIKLAIDELEHAQKHWTDVEAETKTALINNFATMVTNFKESASEGHGKVFTDAVSDKYKNPVNFSKWNEKTDWQKFFSDGRKALRPALLTAASRRDAATAAAAELLKKVPDKSDPFR